MKIIKIESCWDCPYMSINPNELWGKVKFNESPI